MTFAHFLVLWAVTSLAVGILAGRAIAHLRLDGKPRHLLTTRQAAARLGVSTAAVAAWQSDGLIPTVWCPACGRAAIPPTALRPIEDRALVDLTVAVPTGALR